MHKMGRLCNIVNAVVKSFAISYQDTKNEKSETQEQNQVEGSLGDSIDLSVKIFDDNSKSLKENVLRVLEENIGAIAERLSGTRKVKTQISNSNDSSP